ncbi:hypothetical protein BpHYR1_031046 [Brachionus plicatilis]|uniref:Uncharacterized protein n=1 Tax=Brachionus plicatilis TaxID=10195 RepID=A0A3M7RJX8_BRAPC|nr:hypothetical protein BpHYR1_031046 [Brachionus plicatilis]
MFFALFSILQRYLTKYHSKTVRNIYKLADYFQRHIDHFEHIVPCKTDDKLLTSSIVLLLSAHTKHSGLVIVIHDLHASSPKQLKHKLKADKQPLDVHIYCIGLGYIKSKLKK